MSKSATNTASMEIGGINFSVERPHRFGLVINGTEQESSDYLHTILLTPENRDAFFSLIESEGLVVCKNVRSNESSYRKVRGKSSHGKLSQAEYYHHDGCSCPTKPRVVEIRLPHQDIERGIATAIAPFPSVVRSMLESIPNCIELPDEIREWKIVFATANTDDGSVLDSNTPPVEDWDKIQGRVTRLVRKELDAESCRTYFRAVDAAAHAYDLPWEMGESRLMLNNHDDLSKTMQHRRAYQRPRAEEGQNGSLVKRWTAEEA